MELGKVKSEVAKFAKDKYIDVQNAWDIFFFDEFLSRLSKSKYRNMFVFKGGFYLQSVVGVETRSTMDIDLKLIGHELDNNELETVVSKICSICDNDITFRVLSINDIRAETKYGGKTISIESHFYNIKKIFKIDVGFGDVVTPFPIEYNYHLSFKNDECKLLAYTIESIIAEKFETLIAKGTSNSRSKDLFDLYLLNKTDYDIDVLNAAMVNTFNLRKTPFDKDIILNTLMEIFDFERVETLYKNYAAKNKFAKNVSFEMCKSSVYSIFNNLKFNEKIKLSNYGVELHVVRHGEDEQDKVGGWSDNHLTDKGLREIKNLLPVIEEYDLFISSDLKRAKETSEIINSKLNMDITFNNGFRETNNGDFKNLTKDEFLKHHRNYIFASLKMDEKYPGGESPKEFYERVKTEFINLLENNKNKKILLITHGGVITVILCLLNGYAYSNLLKITPSTGSIMKLK